MQLNNFTIVKLDPYGIIKLYIFHFSLLLYVLFLILKVV